MFSLILFAMVCGLSVGMMVVIILAAFFAGLLSSGKYVGSTLKWNHSMYQKLIISHQCSAAL